MSSISFKLISWYWRHSLLLNHLHHWYFLLLCSIFNELWNSQQRRFFLLSFYLSVTRVISKAFTSLCGGSICWYCKPSLVISKLASTIVLLLRSLHQVDVADAKAWAILLIYLIERYDDIVLLKYRLVLLNILFIDCSKRAINLVE